jgi:hypothetical protein
VKSTTVYHSIFPGRYRVTRKAQVVGRSRSRSIECSNPTYGFAQLDEWEEFERAIATSGIALLPRPKTVERAFSPLSRLFVA